MCLSLKYISASRDFSFRSFAFTSSAHGTVPIESTLTYNLVALFSLVGGVESQLIDLTGSFHTHIKLEVTLRYML